jgi:hypothetical protein
LKKVQEKFKKPPKKGTQKTHTGKPENLRNITRNRKTKETAEKNARLACGV